MKKKILTLLVLLMTAVSGAWAEESSETFATNQGQLEYTGQHVKVTATHLYDSGVIMLFRQGQQATIETLNGETINSIVVTASVNPVNCTDVKTTAGNVQGGNPTTTITGINATSVILSSQYYVGISEITVYYDAPAAPAESIDLTTTDNLTWTLASMPEYNLELEVEYYDEVTLTDGSAITALNDFKGKEVWVNYSRQFTGGKTATVCLPFDYKKKEGDGSFYAFTNIKKENGEYVATMTEPISTTLTAGTPYLYLPNATGAVDFGGAYTIPAELTAGETTSNDWTFKGTFETIEWATAQTGIYGFSAQRVDDDGISQGEFVQVGEFVKINPMRCYLQYKDGTEDYAGARAAEQLPATIKVRLVSASGEVNGIGRLNIATGEATFGDGAWYSLDGRRVQTPTKGVYVKNGRKVVIK